MDRSGTWKRISRNWGLYLLLLPALVLLILFAYKPMYGVVIAFKNYKNSLGILGSPWADPLFKNFQRFFNSYQCETTIRNTLRLSLYSLAVGFPIPIILALMINQISAMRFRRTFQTILYLPHFISTVVMVGLLLIWLSPSSGLVGAFYRLLGKDAPNVDALQHAATNRRDTAVAAKKAAEEEAARQVEEQRKAAARHIEAQTFSVDLPEYWDGRVTAEVDGDAIGLYSTAFPDKELGYLAMKNEPYGNAGDIECGRIRDIKLDENHYVKLVIYRWAFDAGQDHLLKAAYRLNLCSDDAAREIVDLQSLGTISYDSILAEIVAANDPTVAAVCWPDDIFANALAPTVKLL